MFWEQAAEGAGHQRGKVGEGQAPPVARKRPHDFSAVARVGGSVAKYRSDQESA